MTIIFCNAQCDTCDALAEVLDWEDMTGLDVREWVRSQDPMAGRYMDALDLFGVHADLKEGGAERALVTIAAWRRDHVA